MLKNSENALPLAEAENITLLGMLAAPGAEESYLGSYTSWDKKVKVYTLKESIEDYTGKKTEWLYAADPDNVANTTQINEAVKLAD